MFNALRLYTALYSMLIHILRLCNDVTLNNKPAASYNAVASLTAHGSVYKTLISGLHLKHFECLLNEVKE